LKKDLEKLDQLRIARIKNVEECVKNFTTLIMEPSPKVNELFEFMCLPDKKIARNERFI
jgi:hypothetical protein